MKQALICFAIGCALWACAGACDGINEAIKFHPSKFFARHQRANMAFWGDPADTWCNKYATPCQELKPKFFGSTTYFAWLTDSYHLLRTLERAFVALGFVFALLSFTLLYARFRLYVFVILISSLYLAQGFGFWLTYSLIY